MKGIVRQGDFTSGHSCYPPTVASSWSKTVTINGRGVVCKGDTIVEHCCSDSCHIGTYIGDHSVTIEGRSVQITGDPISCGDTCSQSSSDVSSA